MNENSILNARQAIAEMRHRSRAFFDVILPIFYQVLLFEAAPQTNRSYIKPIEQIPV